MLEIGNIVDGKYRILQVIGQGGMGVVYLAINERANKRWAIKEVRHRAENEAGIAEQCFFTELTILRRLSNPHLPSIVDVIHMKDTFLIVMDYIEGRTLERHMKEGERVSQAQIIDWGIQLCDVLDYLHGQSPPIVYGDLKPSNIILRPDESLVLIDFGAAREYSSTEHIGAVSLGTVGYAAPEQYSGNGIIDMRTDLFALGATLYHLYTGDVLQRDTCMGDPERLSGLDSVISRCICSCPEERYQYSSEVKRDLQKLRDLGAVKPRIPGSGYGRIFIAVVTILFIIGVVTVRGVEGYLTERRYDDYIVRAEMSSEAEVCEHLYMDAITLDSSRLEAYTALLELFLLDDRYEYAVLLENSSGYKTEAQKMEKLMGEFSGSEYDRAELAYRLGVAMYYYADGIGNKPNAYRYFDMVVGEDGLGRLDLERHGSKGRLKRARCLRNIAGYYERLYTFDRTGDETASFKCYWDDMTAMIAENIVAEDNYKTALLIYREFLTTVRDQILYFKGSNITKEEIIAEVDRVYLHIEADFTEILAIGNPILKESIEKEIASIAVLGGQIMDRVDMAYVE